MRTAGGTGNGFRMKTSIPHVFVFPVACFAQWELFHCGVESIEGDLFYEAVSGAALGAGGKGVSIVA